MPQYDYSIRKLAKKKFKQKKSIKKISRELDISPKTTKLWKAKYLKNGQIRIKKRKGRPSKLSKSQKQQVKTKLKYKNKSSRDVKNIFLRNGTKVAHTTITRQTHRGRKDLGYKTVIRKPLLHEHHKLRRVQFAEDNKDMDFKKVAFTDSKYWVFQFSNRNNMKKAWVDVRDKPLKYVPKDKK